MVRPQAAERECTQPPAAHPLDRIAWLTLTGRHAHVATGEGRARRYPADFAPFAAVEDPDDERCWLDLRQLYADGERLLISGTPGFSRSLPGVWAVEAVIPGVQLVATAAHRSEPDEEAFVIGEDDAAEAADLVARTEPGPFRPRTYELGTYLGLRRDGRLVALAGERLHPPGWSELSAVCTDPDYRGQGLATRLLRAVAHLVRERGETPFLHTSATNRPAIALYRRLGYELRREVDFVALRALPSPTTGVRT